MPKRAATKLLSSLQNKHNVIREPSLASTLSLSYVSATSRPSIWTQTFCTTTPRTIEGRKLETNREEGVPPEHDHDDKVAQEKEKQIRTPWHREGSNVAPVSRPRSAGAMTKGKLLTTPSRMLKLIIPLTTIDKNVDRKTVEPLALLVHPQQPLSYLERLIQSELPAIKTAKGEDKIPAVHFRAEDAQSSDSLEPSARSKSKDKATEQDEQDEQDEKTEEEDKVKDNEDMGTVKVDGKAQRTGVVNSNATELRGGPGEGGVESYSGSGREGPDSKNQNFVRWSASTEIGDFIRDAARGKEFALEIEGAEHEIRVGVPSFNDRTFYLRHRLRRLSTQLSDMAQVKKECDIQAQAVAQRIAIGGFALMSSWWGGVYYLTFETDLGWDTMEPVTYLVGLSGIMCGYLWFLYHNREVSYRAAMNLTVSRRQSKLYQLRGLNIQRWEEMIKEATQLRSEIQAVAREYDVDWDESRDEKDKAVVEALKKEEKKKENKRKKDDDDEDDD